MEKVVSFHKLKLTNNISDKNGYVSNGYVSEIFYYFSSSYCSLIHLNIVLFELIWFMSWLPRQMPMYYEEQYTDVLPEL